MQQLSALQRDLGLPDAHLAEQTVRSLKGSVDLLQALPSTDACKHSDQDTDGLPCSLAARLFGARSSTTHTSATYKCPSEQVHRVDHLVMACKLFYEE